MKLGVCILVLLLTGGGFLQIGGLPCETKTRKSAFVETKKTCSLESLTAQGVEQLSVAVCFTRGQEGYDVDLWRKIFDSGVSYVRFCQEQQGGAFAYEFKDLIHELYPLVRDDETAIYGSLEIALHEKCRDGEKKDDDQATTELSAQTASTITIGVSVSCKNTDNSASWRDLFELFHSYAVSCKDTLYNECDHVMISSPGSSNALGEVIIKMYHFSRSDDSISGVLNISIE